MNTEHAHGQAKAFAINRNSGVFVMPDRSKPCLLFDSVKKESSID